MNSDKITETAYLQRIVPALMEWYPNHKRDLPWRVHPLPYYVWISEVMLQQTRVETVIPYYLRFLKKLPSVGDLAGCPPEELMKLWEGIGYYSRARNLQRAAKVVMEVYGGSMPGTKEELLKLPGIGSYTASAISSIAYGRCEAAVDGNVLRVSTRLLEDSACIDEPRVKKRWEEIWTAVMRQYQESHPEEVSFPGTFNQAMMEIGATVCVPGGTPVCSRCPLSLQPMPALYVLSCAPSWRGAALSGSKDQAAAQGGKTDSASAHGRRTNCPPEEEREGAFGRDVGAAE